MKMMILQKAQRLAEIIIRVKLGTATGEEREELVMWLDEDERNRRLFQRIVRGMSLAKRLKVEDEINRTTDFRELQAAISNRIVRRRYRKYIVSGGVVAACMLVLWGLNVIFFHKEEIGLAVHGNEYVEKDALLSEKDKVMLILEDGREVSLIHPAQDSMKLLQMSLVADAGMLSYRERKDSLAVESVYHKIVTTVGGEYQLVLSDGTHVWLNAESELVYPVRFQEDARVVHLKGEAYFEVTSDTSAPFIVETEDVQTKVLGTSFNVSAYQDEEEVITTLITGKVEVQLKSEEEMPPVLLVPGMQSRWQKETGEFALKRVNVEDETAWIYGVFVFTEDDIAVVTRVLSRWYGVTFKSVGQRKGRHTFSGRVSKDESIESILKTLTMAGGPMFKIEKDTVYIIE